MSANYTPPGYGSTPVATTEGKKPKKEKQATKRSASTLKWLFVAFAAMAGLLVIFALTSGGAAATYVVRSAANLPAMAEVPLDKLEAIALPEGAIEPDTFKGATPEEALEAASTFMTGKWLVTPMPISSQLRTSDFSALGDLSTPLGPDERLVSISAKAANSVAGAVRAGDHVDLYVSYGADGRTGLLGADVEVVAVSILPEQFDSAASQQINDPTKSLSDIVPPEPIPGTYVVRIPADDVARFVSADVAGKIYVALRGAGAVDALGVAPVNVEGALCPENSMDPTCGEAAPVTDEVITDTVDGTVTPTDPNAVTDPNAAASPAASATPSTTPAQ